LYGPETWSLIFKEEHRLKICEDRVLRRISRPKRDEATGGWRKLHSDEIYNFYSLLNVIKSIKSVRMKCAGHVARMREGRRRIILEWVLGKYDGVAWIGIFISQLRVLVNTVINLWIPQKFGRFLSS
jgi:hypothetical protein